MASSRLISLLPAGPGNVPQLIVRQVPVRDASSGLFAALKTWRVRARARHWLRLADAVDFGQPGPHNRRPGGWFNVMLFKYGLYVADRYG